MAIAVTTDFWVRPGGADTNGGGFNHGNANFLTDLACASGANTATPAVTSASYTFVAGDVDAWLFIKSGTQWIPGLYKITAVNAGAATLDAAVGKVVLYKTAPVTGTAFLRPVLDGRNTSVGCGTDDSPSGGGTFSINYAFQDAAEVAVTDAVADGTTLIESEDANFTPAMKGNLIYLEGGTEPLTGTWREVVQVTDENSITVDANVAAGTGITLNLGGAYATPHTAAARNATVGRTWTFVQSGTYLQTTSFKLSNNAGGGGSGAATYEARTTVKGFYQVPGDLDFEMDRTNHPVFRNNNTTNIVIDCQVADLSYFNDFWNIVADGGAGASKSTVGFSTDQFTGVYNCTATRCTAHGFLSDSTADLNVYWRCLCYRMESGATAGFQVESNCIECWAHDNGCEGFHAPIFGLSFIRCISSFNSGQGWFGDALGQMWGCIAWGNGDDGIENADVGMLTTNNIQHNVFGRNTGYGIHNSNAGRSNTLRGYGNAFYENSSGTYSNFTNIPGDITLTECPFVGPFNARDAAWTAATKTLVKTGAFADAYVGGKVHIAGGTGMTAGRYTIATVVDADEITLVESAGGADASDVEIRPIFELNDIAGGGADLRSAGLGTFPGSVAVGFPDVGAFQHEEAEAGGGGGLGISQGLHSIEAGISA